MLIGLAGLKRAGKDTVADYLVKNRGFVKYSFADPLKEACKVLFGLSDSQVHDSKDVVDSRYACTPREILQHIGTAARAQRKTVFVDRFLGWYAATYASSGAVPDVVVADVRFQNEVDSIRALGGVVFLVSRPGVNVTLDAHESERASELDVDGHILNDGTIDDLYRTLFGGRRSPVASS